MAETAKGIPYQELTDPPNGAAASEDLADWLEDTLTGTAQQQLTADPVQVNDLAWRYPRARTATSTAGMTGAAIGDIGVPTAGGDAGKLHIHNGTGFVNVTPDVSLLPKGNIARATKTANETIGSPGTWVDVSGLSVSVALASDRRYVIAVQAAVQWLFDAGLTDPRCGAHGRILVNGVSQGYWLHEQRQRPVSPQVLHALGHGSTAPIIGGGGGAVTIKAQIQRLAFPESYPCSVIAAVDNPAWISVTDVGPV